jgi:hypothetical protein
MKSIDLYFNGNIEIAVNHGAGKRDREILLLPN